jgi:hypothetical protein
MLIFTEMPEHGVSPDVFNYSTVVACRIGRLADSMEKFSQMFSTGVQPNHLFIVFPNVVQRYSLSSSCVLLFDK